jgi:hypothetical protein
MNHPFATSKKKGENNNNNKEDFDRTTDVER